VSVSVPHLDRERGWVLLTGVMAKDEHKEMQADLRHPNLRPRTHALAAEGGKWGGKEIGGDKYHRGDGIDLPEVHTLFRHLEVG
jgi:hypothetical protein